MVKKILRKFFQNPYKIAKKNGVIINKTFLSKNFDIIKFEEWTPKIIIGEKCILNCNLIFETKTGSITIGNGTYIGGGTRLISCAGIDIGSNVTIAWGVTIYDHNSHSIDYLERIKDQERQLEDWPTGNFIANKNWSVVSKKEIKICDNAWIGFDAVILKGVTIGEGAIVGARSVVAKDVEPWTIVAGNPARTIRRIERNDIHG